MTDRKATRTMSQETQLRVLLRDSINETLQLRELVRGLISDSAKNTKVILAKFDANDESFTKLLRAIEAVDRKAASALSLAGDSLSKVNDLHHKSIGSTDRLGKRVYDLEQARGKGNHRPSRSPR